MKIFLREHWHHVSWCRASPTSPNDHFRWFLRYEVALERGIFKQGSHPIHVVLFISYTLCLRSILRMWLCGWIMARQPCITSGLTSHRPGCVTVATQPVTALIYRRVIGLRSMETSYRLVSTRGYRSLNVLVERFCGCNDVAHISQPDSGWWHSLGAWRICWRRKVFL